MEDISRRSFLTGAVAVAGIAATAGLAGARPNKRAKRLRGQARRRHRQARAKRPSAKRQHGWAMHRRSKNRTS